MAATGSAEQALSFLLVIADCDITTSQACRDSFTVSMCCNGIRKAFATPDSAVGDKGPWRVLQMTWFLNNEPQPG